MAYINGKEILFSVNIINNFNPDASLLYELSADGTYYIVKGRGTVTGSEIIIPLTYEGLPVKHIAENAFKNDMGIASVTIGINIEQIGKNAFYGCANLLTVILMRELNYGASADANNCFYGWTDSAAYPNLYEYTAMQRAHILREPITGTDPYTGFEWGNASVNGDGISTTDAVYWQRK